MGQERVIEHFFDFSGGLNSTFNPDTLQDNELVQCTNARVDANKGAITKRTGTKRMTAAQFESGAAFTGLTFYEKDSAPMLYGVVNGRSYFRLNSTGNFGAFSTDSSSSEFSTTAKCHMKPMRDSTSGAALKLYLCDGVKTWSTVASTVAVVSGVGSVPVAILLQPYHTRMFFQPLNFKTQIQWSKTGLPENAATGTLITDGGQGLIGMAGDNEIVAFETIGSSLCIYSGDAIHRFTGYSNEDIRIDQDTEGISNEVGAVGGFATQRVEGLGFFLSDRGPYAHSESEVKHIGRKVEAEFDALDSTSTNMAAAVVGFHRGRREVWFAVPGASDGNLNKTVYTYNLRSNSWNGPFTYPFGITCFSRWEDTDGEEWIVAGCSDGWIRHMDIGALDDVVSDGTGGSAYTMTVELKPLVFGLPGIQKSLRSVFLQGDLPTGAGLKVGISVDGSAFTTAEITEVNGAKLNYRIDIANAVAVGYRYRLQLTDASSTIPIVYGVSVEGTNTNRR